MPESISVEWLSKEVSQAARSAKFCTSGCLPDVDPGLEVENLGAVRFPLKQAVSKQLREACRVAPYGKGMETLVNKKVRNTLELDPKKFRLSAAWDSAIANVTCQVAVELGLPTDQLEAKLYKLLVYERGGFFVPHRDSEKLDRMVASLIVVLPNRFEGGALIVRHGAVKKTIEFKDAADGEASCFAAFYADCEHEVRPVVSGVRVALAYNLVLSGKRAKSAATTTSNGPADALALSIGNWVERQPTKPLVFALEHHYTQCGLSLELLKGADRELADLIVAAAETGNCVAYLAQVSRHLLQFADDGSLGNDWRYGARRSARRQKLTLGETYDDDLIGTDWTSLDGKKQPWGDIAFDLSAIVASEPIDQWKPTSEDFEGYTGNAGNTLDRWYHRSAIVVWHRDRHFDVIAQSGQDNCLPLFCSLAAKLKKTPKKRLEEARLNCVRFAYAIIAQWPDLMARFGGRVAARENEPAENFAEHLLPLHDRDVVSLFLTTLSKRDPTVRLSSLVMAACREFGGAAFATEMRSLLSVPPALSSPRPTHFRLDVPLRDIEWLSVFCCEKWDDVETSALARELCQQAVERFCEPMLARPRYYIGDTRGESSVAESSLPLLLKALTAAGCADDLSRVMGFVQASPGDFHLDDCMVPALKSLIPWASKRLGTVPAPLADWLATVRSQLESVTAREPSPPSDWSRPANIDCDCQFCAQLKTFLADPSQDVGRIRAGEHYRNHVISMIRQHRCDVTDTLERKGSPHTLVLTKTTGSFDRAVKRFKTDQKLLAQLPLRGHNDTKPSSLPNSP